MRRVTWSRPLLGLFMAGLFLLTTGCGDTARQSFKQGLYNYVGGSLRGGIISVQLRDFIADVLTGGFNAAE